MALREVHNSATHRGQGNKRAGTSMPQLRVQALVLLHSFRRARLSRQDAAGRRREPHFRPLPKKQPGRRSEGGTRAGKGREEEGKVPPFQAKSQRLPENHSLSQSLPLLAKSPREGREPPLSLTHTHLFFSSPRAATAALEDYRHRRGRRPSKRKRNLVPEPRDPAAAASAAAATDGVDRLGEARRQIPRSFERG